MALTATGWEFLCYRPGTLPSTLRIRKGSDGGEGRGRRRLGSMSTNSRGDGEEDNSGDDDDGVNGMVGFQTLP